MNDPLLKVWRISSLPADWAERGQILNRKKALSLEKSVQAIMEQVRKKGDTALVRFTKKFDKATLEATELRVTAEEIEKAYEAVSEEQVSAIEFMRHKLGIVEKRILEQIKIEFEENDILVCSQPRPIQSVGCYVPGGEAAYPSTLVMTAVPAKIAGVPRMRVRLRQQKVRLLL
jgi:histidinol dehydrogenase